MSDSAPDRHALVRRAIRLEYFTIGYNLLEGLASLLAGGIASSIALIGFGLDSFVESFSGWVVLGRFRDEARGTVEHSALETRALRYLGWSFLFLAVYVAIQSGRKLWFLEKPDPSVLGIIVAALSLVIMPWLAHRKYRTGRQLDSRAMVADSKETLACSLLSVALLLGLGLNAALDWWWADPAAGLAMVPWLVKEGREALEPEEEHV